MAEVLALLMAALLATALAHYIKKWLRPLAARDDLPRWPRRFVIAGMVLAPSLLGVVLILGLRVLFASFGLPTALIDIAMDLATVLVLVRFALHVLSVSLGPEQLDPRLGAQAHVRALGDHFLPGARLVRGVERTLDSIDLAARQGHVHASGRCSRASWSSSVSWSSPA